MILRLLLAAIATCLPIFASSYAACVYPPFEFFPEKNGGVRVLIRVDQGSSCRHRFAEGPGYHFTSVSIANAPLRGTLKEIEDNAFLYTPREEAKDGDFYTFEICATKGRQSGCNLIVFEVLPEGASAEASEPSSACGKGPPDFVIRECTPIVENPKSTAASRVRALNKRGGAYFQSGDLGRALADFSAAIEIDATGAEAYNNRGLVSQSKHDLDGAVRDYEKAIALYPKCSACFANRGNVYRWKGGWTQAIADYDRALSLNPRLDEAYFGRGFARQQLNDLDGALADLTKALESGRHSAEWHTARANIFRLKGDDEKALADYDIAVKLAPQGSAGLYTGGYAGRGQLLSAQGEFNRALADFDAVVQELSRRGELPRNALHVYGSRGMAHFALGNFSAAAADLAKLRGASPPEPYAALWLYLAEARNGNASKSGLKELAGGTAWPSPIASFLLGGLTREELGRAANQGEEKARPGQSCEAAFYLGEQALLEKRMDEAKTLIKQAAETCPRGFIEHGAALAEFRRLQQ